MYFDFFVAKGWEYLPAASVQTVYKLYTDPDYSINHHIIDPEKYVLFYTLDGCGEIEVSGVKYQAKPNTVFFANTNLSLKYHCAAERWNFWLVEFKADRFPFQVNHLYSFPFRADYYRLFGEMLDSLKCGTPLLSAALLQVLCYHLFYSLRDDVYTEDSLMFSQCVSYMEIHLNQFSLERLCKDTGIGARTLNNLFHRMVDMPPYQYYQCMRAERSKEYLENTDMSIAQVSTTLGYINSGHFSRIFKKFFGKTPSQYRTTFRLK